MSEQQEENEDEKLFEFMGGILTPLQSRTRGSPVTEDENVSTLTPEAELLRWPVQLGHLSYWKL